MSPHQRSTTGGYEAVGREEAAYFNCQGFIASSGYLWSKVYALNIVNEYKRDGMTNQTTGMRFRDEILARGKMDDEMVLLKAFLGKEPAVDVLYKHLGINVTQSE